MISFNVISRDFPVTESIQFELEQSVSKLEKIFSRISACDIVLSLPHKHLHKGRTFHIALKVHVPGEVLIVNREPELNQTHEDFHLAVRDAFQAMKRQLVDFVARQNGKVKQHAI